MEIKQVLEAHEAKAVHYESLKLYGRFRDALVLSKEVRITSVSIDHGNMTSLNIGNPTHCWPNSELYEEMQSAMISVLDKYIKKHADELKPE